METIVTRTQSFKRARAAKLETIDTKLVCSNSNQTLKQLHRQKPGLFHRRLRFHPIKTDLFQIYKFTSFARSNPEQMPALVFFYGAIAKLQKFLIAALISGPEFALVDALLRSV
jgi:hypothetical protein